MARGRILVVEDEPMLQMLIEDICEGIEIDISECVDNVPDALLAVAKGDFNAVLLDVNLQGETSESVAVALQGQGKPVIVSTGSYPGELPVAYQNFTIIQKPFNVRELSLLLCQTAFLN